MRSKLYCDGIARRDFVRIGGLTAFGVGLGNLTSLARAETNQRRIAKSCILIWLDGGPTHLETFDPKPDAPVEVRGPFGAIETSVSGIRIGECLPQIAGQMDKIAIVRSMTSPLGEHNFGTHYMMTGYRPSAALAYPPMGATVAQRASDGSVLPANIAVPRFTRNIASSGFLSSRFAPFEVGGNPDARDFKVRDLDFYQGLDLQRLSQRKAFVEAIDRFGGHDVTDPDLRRAYDLVASKEAKEAFDLSREPEALRRRYGRGGGTPIGQSCLLARRLVERGVPFVTVHSSGWDSHKDLKLLRERYPGDPNAHLPSLDRAFSTLVSDLDDRGMLDETLVLVMGEFGRTPKVNTNGGRDHWPNVFSVAMAGGGVVGGQVIGSSDRLGESPKDRPVTPADLVATVFDLLGIDPTSMLSTNDGRPIRITPDSASVVKELRLG